MPFSTPNWVDQTVRTGLRVERPDGRLRVDGVDPAVADDRRRREARSNVATLADVDGPGLAERLADRDMAHRLRGIAARLAPFGVGDRLGEGHRQRGRGRIDRDVLFDRENGYALAEDGRLGRCPS